jgi:hypothetical protein
MSKLFECTACGTRWVVYVGEGKSSLCCKKPMTPVDDGQPDPPTRMELKEAFDLIRKEEGDE